MAEMTQTPSTPRPGGSAGERGSTVVNQAERQAQRAMAETKELGSEAMAAVRDSATTFFEEQRDRAATEIAAVGNLLCSSVQLLDRNGGTIGHYARDAGKQINDFADRLRTRSWGELWSDVEGFARDNPMIFIAAAVGVGFVGARLIAASANQPVGETPMQSSMALVKDAGEQIRDTLRSEPAAGTASVTDTPTPGAAAAPGSPVTAAVSSAAPTTAPDNTIGTPAGTIGGPGRH